MQGFIDYLSEQPIFWVLGGLAALCVLACMIAGRVG
jgi:hypothetical protein